jgi:hypothetical protein
VIVSLLISSIMLGKQGTTLVAIIRTTNRKQELEMLVGELSRARSSNIPKELLAHARRATERGEPSMELVCRHVARIREVSITDCKAIVPCDATRLYALCALPSVRTP